MTVHEHRGPLTPLPWTTPSTTQNLIEQFENGDLSMIGDDLNPDVALGRLGWKVIGQGGSRRVYAQGDQVLKYGCPDENRTEYHTGERLAELGCPYAMPVSWISPGGVFLRMPRAELSLDEALTRQLISGHQARKIQEKMEEQGATDCKPCNIGYWNGHWRMLDLSESWAGLGLKRSGPVPRRLPGDQPEGGPL